MPASLYQLLGRRVEMAGGVAGTAITRQVETVDNDQVQLDVFAVAADLSAVEPGTRLTFTVETVDNDEVAGLAGLEPLAVQSDSGTTRTSAVETADEEAITLLGALG